MTVDDLYSLAEEEQIGVYAFALGKRPALSVQHEDGSCDIALNLDVVSTSAEETVLLAHELGHCTTGSFYNRYTPFDVRQKHENRADRWAVKHLLPFDSMLSAMRDGYTTVWDLAERFNVTPQFVKTAYDYWTGPAGRVFAI